MVKPLTLRIRGNNNDFTLRITLCLYRTPHHALIILLVNSLHFSILFRLQNFYAPIFPAKFTMSCTQMFNCLQSHPQKLKINNINDLNFRYMALNHAL